MRREIRRQEEEKKMHNLLYVGGSLLAIAVIAFAIVFFIYGNNMEKQSILDTQKFSSLVEENTNTQQASTQMGKTVEESQNQTITENKTETKSNTQTKQTKTDTKKQTETKKEEVKQETKKDEQQENKQEIKFTKPIDGEIVKEYAKDKLVYSETLKEWTTHLGWDIKADKTTVVKAACSGKVKSIKNDPRYGLSVIIEHQDGYETLYSNLLSSEFVQVGEEIKQSDSIGTVGNTAAFEIADESHLHFEITKNGENVDPSTLIK